MFSQHVIKEILNSNLHTSVSLRDYKCRGMQLIEYAGVSKTQQDERL